MIFISPDQFCVDFTMVFISFLMTHESIINIIDQGLRKKYIIDQGPRKIDIIHQGPRTNRIIDQGPRKTYMINQGPRKIDIIDQALGKQNGETKRQFQWTPKLKTKTMLAG